MFDQIRNNFALVLLSCSMHSNGQKDKRKIGAHLTLFSEQIYILVLRITQDIILFTLAERFILQKLGLTDQPHGNELACREQ